MLVPVNVDRVEVVLLNDCIKLVISVRQSQRQSIGPAEDQLVPRRFKAHQRLAGCLSAEFLEQGDRWTYPS